MLEGNQLYKYLGTYWGQLQSGFEKGLEGEEGALRSGQLVGRRCTDLVSLLPCLVASLNLVLQARECLSHG